MKLRQDGKTAPAFVRRITGQVPVRDGKGRILMPIKVRRMAAHPHMGCARRKAAQAEEKEHAVSDRINRNIGKGRPIAKRFIAVSPAQHSQHEAPGFDDIFSLCAARADQVELKMNHPVRYFPVVKTVPLSLQAAFLRPG